MATFRVHAAPSLADNVSTYVHDVLATARNLASSMRRYPSWLLNLSIGPFLAILPFIFLGDTLVGRNNRLSGTYFDKLGYEGYVGYLVVPMIAVALSNTVFSWISGLPAWSAARAPWSAFWSRCSSPRPSSWGERWRISPT